MCYPTRVCYPTPSPEAPLQSFPKTLSKDTTRILAVTIHIQVILALILCILGIYALPQEPPIERQKPPIERQEPPFERQEPPIEEPQLINIASMPTITVRQTTCDYDCGYDIPAIAITFADGFEDELVLEKHFPSEEARLENKEHCNYYGHLKNDPNACVAVTGCYGQDDLEFTIMSDHTLSQNQFVLEKNGQLKAIQNDGIMATGQIENSEEESRWNGRNLLLSFDLIVDN